MPRVTIRLYAELNDHRPAEQRMKPVPVDFTPPANVREILTTLGVPEHDVELVLLNGDSVDLAHAVEDGDRISIFPVFESFDVGSIVCIRPLPLRRTRFILDVHLGKLASYLRLLGFDTLYRSDFDDDQLITISNSDGRIILSRDRRLLASGLVTRGYLVRQTNPRLQLSEVVQRFDLYSSMNPFQRCLRCNTLLRKIDKAEILQRLPPRTRENFEEFNLCPTCQRAYWKGSHYVKMQDFVRRVLLEGGEWYRQSGQSSS